MNYLFFKAQSLYILGEGFGFNGNILETNILNLSVVIGIVVSLGGDALRDLLDNRKQSIINTLSASEERAKQALETLEIAKKEYAFAQKKAKEISENAIVTAKQVATDSEKQTNSDILRLEETKNSRTSTALSKAKKDVSSYTIKLALNRARAKLEKVSDSSFQENLNNSQLVVLKNWSF